MDLYSLRGALLLAALIFAIPGVAQQPGAPQAPSASATGNVTVVTATVSDQQLEPLSIPYSHDELFPPAQQSNQQPAQPQVSSSEASARSDSRETAEQSEEGKKGTRVFGILPNNLTVEGAKNVTRISTGEKFKLVGESAFDPYEFGIVGLLAGIGQATNNDPSYGQGMKGYGLRYASGFGDQVIGNFMVGAVLPSVFRQDPRYFQSGKGSFLHRAGYALSRIVVTRGDSGRTQFNVSEIAGNGMAAAISNLYHPAADRSLLETSQTWGTQISVDALGYELKEFWPDIRRKVFRMK